jgi:uncharacterized protein with PQ loop repeat
MEITEVIGWVGNVVVIISFLQKNIKKLRLYGLIGALVWVVYAIRIESNSLIILNLIIMGIQSYHLWKIRKEEKKREHPWMYPIVPKKWQEDIPPIVSSLELEEELPPEARGFRPTRDDNEFQEDPFVS